MKQKMKKGVKIFLIIITVILVMAIAALGMIIYKMKTVENQMSTTFPNMSGMMNGMDFTGMTTAEFVTAYGVTSIGTKEESFPIDELTVGLEVEEVLVTNGDSVNTQTAILKFTDDSVAEVKDRDVANRVVEVV